MTLQEQNNLKFGSRLYFPGGIGPAELAEGSCGTKLQVRYYICPGEFIRTTYKKGTDYCDPGKTRTYKCARVRVYMKDLRWETREIPLKICFLDKDELKRRLEKEFKEVYELAARRSKVPTRRIDLC